MPVGLKDGGGERTCDTEARKLLGKRRSSIFPVPCRKAMPARTREEAGRINRKKLTVQSWNIIPTIRQIDDFLKGNEHAREVIKETHPEVCFTALNGGKPMTYSKSKSDEHKRGIEERKEVLHKYCDVDRLFSHAREKFRLKKDAGDDDILDALAAAVTALKGKENLAFLGEDKPDSKGLLMRIWYYKPSA